MLPNITSVEVNPSVLNAGETDIIVKATVTDDVGVTSVLAVPYNPTDGYALTSEV